MEKKDLNRLSHILDAAKTIQQHIQGKKESDLERDRLLLGGIIRELLLIGEAANAVSPKTKAQTPSIPWKEIIGMRNQLIHSYFEISYKIIWMTVTDDIPKLISELETIPLYNPGI
jgi:uncharacterized protein with HEPN domain